MLEVEIQLISLVKVTSVWILGLLILASRSCAVRVTNAIMVRELILLLKKKGNIAGVR